MSYQQNQDALNSIGGNTVAWDRDESRARNRYDVDEEIADYMSENPDFVDYLKESYGNISLLSDETIRSEINNYQSGFNLIVESMKYFKKR